MSEPNVGHEAQLIQAAAAGGAPLQQVKTSYQTAVAVQRPRTLRDVTARLEEEASIAGESFYYGWAAGKDRIEGPSKNLAMAAARCWGNCAVELGPIQETHEAWIFTAYFVDLETGYTLPRQFRQSKRWMVYGKLDSERKDDVRFQIGQSKAIRNVIINALPASLIDKAMDMAKKGVRDRIQKYIDSNGIDKARDVALAELKKMGASEERVLSRLEAKAVPAIDLDDLVRLQGDIKALRDGEDNVNSLFPPIGGDSVSDASRTDAMKDKLASTKPDNSPLPTSEPPSDDAPTGGGEAAEQADKPKPENGRRKKTTEQGQLAVDDGDGAMPEEFSVSHCDALLRSAAKEPGTGAVDATMEIIRQSYASQGTDEDWRELNDLHASLVN